jgi:acyl-CoA thioester hydrolase
MRPPERIRRSGRVETAAGSDNADMPRIHVRTFVVPPEAIDGVGHVNNLEYLHWMLDAASEHTAAQGWPLARYVAAGAGWVVRSHAIEYLRAAFAGETIALATWVAGLTRTRSTRKYAFYRPADDALLAQAQSLWVFVDFRTGRLTRIPHDVKAAFEVVTADAEALASLRAARTA